MKNNNIKKYININNVISIIVIILLFLMFVAIIILLHNGNTAVYSTNLTPGESIFISSEPVSGQGIVTEPGPETEEKMYFTDASGEIYEMIINPVIPKNRYNPASFSVKNNRIEYNDGIHRSRTGIDVSHHQKKIDWKAVASDGIEFAFIRIGYRGYGKEGKLCKDEYFKKNIKGARNAGLDVGVYFFSQAVNEEEAREEADYMLKLLDGIKLDLPVVYDPESIPDDKARTDNVTGEQFTLNSIAFCNKIRDAGYQPMIYSNLMWEAYKLDLGMLQGVPIWYADYQPLPQTPYDFDIWQYSESGKVKGVKGGCDMDILIVDN